MYSPVAAVSICSEIVSPNWSTYGNRYAPCTRKDPTSISTVVVGKTMDRSKMKIRLVLLGSDCGESVYEWDYRTDPRGSFASYKVGRHGG